MNDILEKILEKTVSDLSKRKHEISLRDLESMELFYKESQDFKSALDIKDNVSIIAEVKKASPSKDIIRSDFDHLHIAKEYINNGARAISVLTDEPFFQGSLTYLEEISKISTVPLLRKDFIIEPFQVKEAKAYGADAVLLIATMYNGTQLSELLSAVKEFNLQALVECYHEEEFHALDWDQVEIVGVNNRNLSTFEVDLHRGVSILSQAPENIVRVSESGLNQPDDILFLWENGIHSALIGEYFMRQDKIGEAVKRIINGFEAKK